LFGLADSWLDFAAETIAPHETLYELGVIPEILGQGRVRGKPMDRDKGEAGKDDEQSFH
jgi:hypothetical protein